MSKHRLGCIYLVTGPTGRRYVGITTSTLSRRWSAHRRAAQAKSVRSLLHAAMRKYGEDAFLVEELGVGDAEALNLWEPALIRLLATRAPDGYNLREGGGVSRHHEESRERMRQAHLGRKHSPETIEKMRQVRKGRQPAHMDALWKARRERREEINEKIRAAHKAKGGKLGAEHLANLRAAAKARIYSPERLARMAEYGRMGAAKRWGATAT